MTDRSHSLFEISWEVCNKVGGIHTVLSSKARTAIERLGDDYVLVGPQLLGGTATVPFDEEPGFHEFTEACRAIGIPVRVGRWRIPGRPRTLLVGFSGLYGQKDGILAGLWEQHQVDSIAGDWDYIEPVLFATAAAMVIEKWWEEYLAPFHRRAVVQAHEWMTGASLLYLRSRIPSIGTVFTTHATMLGRALASLGTLPQHGLGGKTPEDLARDHGVRAKHSLESACARTADVFTTVSHITSDEAELLLGRRPDVVLPNGIDLDVVDLLAEGDRNATRLDLARVAHALLGEDVGDAMFVGLAGRYEFHNKGIELLLDAMAAMNASPGRRMVAFLLVPAGNSGLRSELHDRLEGAPAKGPVGLCTHNLFDEDNDPVHRHCRKIGLDNRPGSRMKVVQVPIYLRPDDGLFHREYEAVLAALDLGAYPSFYEPWGYTPQEALATGVPTITTDLAGFGRWAMEEGLGAEDGITVIPRERVPYAEVVTAVADCLERQLASKADRAAMRERCRAAAGRTAWRDLFAHYEAAYAKAMEQVQTRSVAGVQQFRMPRRALSAPGGSGIKPRLATFDAVTTLPAALRGLDRLARNFWWVWNPQVRDLFTALGSGFDQCSENPVLFLHRADPAQLDAKSRDKDYLARVHAAVAELDAYLQAPARSGPGQPDAKHPIAYFSAEFGIHQSLPIYSGGLGILAGDHLKSASDLAVPLVGVGLFYRYGYMTQRLDREGQQLVVDRENNPRELAVEPVLSADGKPLEVNVLLLGREVVLRAWKAQVGRVALYLLDANVAANRPEERDLTRNLYGGDSETRIQQEIILGRGGVRLLRALGLAPSVYHMNEGHAAFLTLERISRLVRGEGLTFDAAREYVCQTTLFTTHTPVPAGHDRFGEDLMRRYFGDCEDWVGLPWDRFFALGQAGGAAREFNMTYLAMNFAGFVNGVSKLHGVASKKLLHPFWPGLLQDEVPVTTITNGVHLATWTHPSITSLLGGGARSVRPADFARGVTDRRALWLARQANKGAMLQVVRAALTRSFHARSDSPVMLSSILSGLDSKALFIGFARRFAPYKRAHLLLTDPQRLLRILDDPNRPVRLIVAGKAHPRDKMGQDIIKRLAQVSREPEFAGKLVFVEDYDMSVARALVQGCDVWLNTPTRMEEASGTSGMKAAANGVLNLSVGDGWWPEAADGRNGWTVGAGQDYADAELQNQADANALYRLLEEEVVPSFFTRNDAGLPEHWLDMVSHCLASVPGRFNTDRMVEEYASKAYLPLASCYFAQQSSKKQLAKDRARDFQKVRSGFSQVRIAAASTVDLQDFKAGQHLDVRMEVELGNLSADDVVAELVIGRPQGEEELTDMTVVALTPTATTSEGLTVFEGGYRVAHAGQYAQGLRIRARGHGGPHEAKLRGLVLWA